MASVPSFLSKQGPHPRTRSAALGLMQALFRKYLMLWAWYHMVLQTLQIQLPQSYRKSSASAHREQRNPDCGKEQRSLPRLPFPAGRCRPQTLAQCPITSAPLSIMAWAASLPRAVSVKEPVHAVCTWMSGFTSFAPSSNPFMILTRDAP